MTERWMWAPVAAALLAGVVSAAQAQTRLAEAKDLYLKADYEQALTLLSELPASEPGAPSDEAHHYRALCLLALGRDADAELAMAAAIDANPKFTPNPADVAPRISRLYDDVRQRQLPLIIRRRLTEARERYQDGEHQRAIEGFDYVLQLLSEPSLVKRDDLADLRLAANGLAELARAQQRPASSPTSNAAAPSMPSPAAAPRTPGVAAPAAEGPTASTGTPARAAAPPRTAASAPPANANAATPVAPGPAGAPAAGARGAAPVAAAGSPVPGLTPPVAITQPLPRWVPPDANTARREFTGAVRVLVDVTGSVVDARMERSVFPTYDRLVVEAARSWRYRPATRDGQPVPGEVIVEIRLRPVAN
jgi:TonB family protein